MRRQLDTAGRTGAVRSELRKGKALQWLLDHVELFDDEGNPISRDDLTVNAAEETEVAPQDVQGEPDELGELDEQDPQDDEESE